MCKVKKICQFSRSIRHYYIKSSANSTTRTCLGWVLISIFNIITSCQGMCTIKITNWQQPSSFTCQVPQRKSRHPCRYARQVSRAELWSHTNGPQQDQAERPLQVGWCRGGRGKLTWFSISLSFRYYLSPRGITELVETYKFYKVVNAWEWHDRGLRAKYQIIMSSLNGNPAK